jgi:hypothetical protein
LQPARAAFISAVLPSGDDYAFRLLGLFWTGASPAT